MKISTRIGDTVLRMCIIIASSFLPDLTFQHQSVDPVGLNCTKVAFVVPSNVQYCWVSFFCTPVLILSAHTMNTLVQECTVRVTIAAI